jgi:SAM-dependent methyltransferase
MRPPAWLQHPLTRGLDLDDPRTTALRRQILQEKPFLRRIYDEWYAGLARELPATGGRVLELGSGAGFMAEVVPRLVRSEVFPTANADVLLDAMSLPFPARALAAIVMTNVLHHIPRPIDFLAEAARCVRPGGVVAMLEPWVTPWSRLVRYLLSGGLSVRLSMPAWTFAAWRAIESALSPWAGRTAMFARIVLERLPEA